MKQVLQTVFAYCWLSLYYFFKQRRLSTDEFNWHHQWRLALAKRRMRRAWQALAFGKFIASQRWLGLILAACVTFVLITLALTGTVGEFALALARFKAQLLTNPTNPANTGAWSLLLILVGTPVAFALWKFRDTNTLWQIENARKDTNLKDFQKLTEWASGQHLIEDKLTRTENLSLTKAASHSNNEIPDTVLLAGAAASDDNKQTLETARIPADAVLATASRREGGVSLQIAAVYQLQGFLDNQFGQQFQRPAFVLLKTVWLSLMQPHLNTWATNQARWIQILSDQKADKDEIEQWQAAIEATATTPLGLAINQALTDHQGALLRQHMGDLQGALLAGIIATGIELDGCDLRQIQFQGADLRYAQLQGADLDGAQLQGANLSRAELQDAYLREAQLQGANLRYAQLQGADLMGAQLQGANLRDAQLQGANLSWVELQGATLVNPCVDQQTRFHDSRCDEKTRVIVFSRYSPGGVIDIASATHALRVTLRDQCDLQLPTAAYQEYLAAWDALSADDKAWLMQRVGTESGYDEIYKKYGKKR